MKSLSLAWSFIVTPAQASRQLHDRPSFLFPLLLITLASAAITAWHYSIVDMDWLKDYLFSGNPRIKALPDADRARFMATMSTRTMIISAVATIVVIVPVFCLIQALYFLVAGRITHVVASFKQWFALTCWSMLPALITVLYAVIVLATSAKGVQLAPSSLQPLSLNELFFHRDPSAPGYALFASLSLLSLWTWALCTIGVRTWSGRSWLFSVSFVLLPFVLFYGIWALLAFRNAG